MQQKTTQHNNSPVTNLKFRKTLQRGIGIRKKRKQYEKRRKTKEGEGDWRTYNMNNEYDPKQQQQQQHRRTKEIGGVQYFRLVVTFLLVDIFFSETVNIPSTV